MILEIVTHVVAASAGACLSVVIGGAMVAGSTADDATGADEASEPEGEPA